MSRDFPTHLFVRRSDMSDLGPYGTTEQFFKRREHLLKNKPKCPSCGKKAHVGIFIQLAPTNWICSFDNTRWNQEV